MSNRTPLLVGIVVVALLVVVALFKSFFVVRVDRFAIVTEFGNPVAEIDEPGFYFRVPFVQEVKYLDKRVRGWDDIGYDTKTADNRQIDYTVFARWRISNALQFYKAVGEEKRAHATMDSIVTDRIQTAVHRRKLAEIVRETGRQFGPPVSVDLRSIYDTYRECNPAVNREFKEALDATDIEALQPKREVEKITTKRSEVVGEILKESNARLVEFGIEIKDLQFKYVNYSPKVHADIIKKIQADRENDISSYIEVGRQCVGYISRFTDSERGQIIGDGQQRVRGIDGEAVAQAIDIKAKAFGQESDFYRFMRLLELYEQSFARETRLVLSSQSPLLKGLQDASALGLGAMPPPPAPPAKGATDAKALPPTPPPPAPPAPATGPEPTPPTEVQ